MLQLQRQNEIMRLLEAHKELTVKELCAMLFYSPATIRRDLSDLEQKGLLRRSFGGAVFVENYLEQYPLEVRATKNIASKKRICAKAAQLIQPGDTVFIAASSTTFFLPPLLKDIPELTVVTNSPHMNIKLSEHKIRNLCTGGEMLTGSIALVGSEAERFIRGIRANKTFFSGRGLSKDGIITDSSKMERDLKITMLEQSQESYYLVDESKIGLEFPWCIAKAADIDGIIDDT